MSQQNKKGIRIISFLLLNFWKGFLAVFLCYLLFTNQLLHFDTPMIELYLGMFSGTACPWAEKLSASVVFILLIVSIFYQLHNIILQDRERLGINSNVTQELISGGENHVH